MPSTSSLIDSGERVRKLDRDHVAVIAPLRSAVRDAVLRMEDARGPIRVRKTLDAELVVLDHFERGGKRYVIAVEHAPRAKATGLSALSAREREVLAAAAEGRTNKVIAYDLGVAHSTVRVLLARAAKRLNATSRQELVAIYRARERAEGEQSLPAAFTGAA